MEYWPDFIEREGGKLNKLLIYTRIIQTKDFLLFKIQDMQQDIAAVLQCKGSVMN